MPRKERHAHRWPSMVRGAMLAQPTRRATYHSSSGAENSFLRRGGNLGRSEGSRMLIGDPLSEGSSASSTDNELWKAENLFLIMRGNSDAQKGVACS